MLYLLLIPDYLVNLQKLDLLEVLSNLALVILNISPSIPYRSELVLLKKIYDSWMNYCILFHTDAVFVFVNDSQYFLHPSLFVCLIIRLETAIAFFKINIVLLSHQFFKFPNCCQSPISHRIPPYRFPFVVFYSITSFRVIFVEIYIYYSY